MILINHNTNPPTHIFVDEQGPECFRIGDAVVNKKFAPGDLPPGIYLDGGDRSPIPAGCMSVRADREIVDGKSYVTHITIPIPDPLLVEAQALMTNADMQESVKGVLERVMAIAALKVDITEWSFQGVTAAAEAAAYRIEVPTRLDILTAACALRTAWDRLLYHVESMRKADLLWPYLYDIAVPPKAEEPIEDPVPPEEPPQP
jgi:hypothetical protein